MGIKRKGSSKEVRDVMKYASEHGFKLVRSRKHFVFKKGVHTVSMSMSPSCPFGPSHAIQDINRCLKKDEKK